LFEVRRDWVLQYAVLHPETPVRVPDLQFETAANVAAAALRHFAAVDRPASNGGLKPTCK
jgi:hypothetical protein